MNNILQAPTLAMALVVALVVMGTHPDPEIRERALAVLRLILGRR
ncbi:hypothetical protein ACIQNI_32005 [Streptomyces sp. NPDC091266]